MISVRASSADRSRDLRAESGGRWNCRRIANAVEITDYWCSRGAVAWASRGMLARGNEERSVDNMLVCACGCELSVNL